MLKRADWLICVLQIWPTLAIRALENLTKVNPFYNNLNPFLASVSILYPLKTEYKMGVQNGSISQKWVDEWDFSEQSDPMLWKLLTSKNAKESNSSYQTESNDDINLCDYKILKKRELK